MMFLCGTIIFMNAKWAIAIFLCAIVVLVVFFVTRRDVTVENVSAPAEKNMKVEMPLKSGDVKIPESEKPNVEKAIEYATSTVDPTKEGSQEKKEFAQFRNWLNRYAKAAPVERQGMEDEGKTLASARRAILRDMLYNDPLQARTEVISDEVRNALPPSVVALMEKRVSGKGNYQIIYGDSEPDANGVRQPSMDRCAVVDGTFYSVGVYGRWSDRKSAKNVDIEGVVIDNRMMIVDK
jgi:hypothetical protein